RAETHAGPGMDPRPAVPGAIRTDSGRMSPPILRFIRPAVAVSSSAAMIATPTKAMVRPTTTRTVLRLAIPDHLANYVVGIDTGCQQLFPDLVWHMRHRFASPFPGVVEDAIAGDVGNDRGAHAVLRVCG